jgi:hypothetical protein
MKREQREAALAGPHAATRQRWEEKCLCGHARGDHALWLEAGAGMVAVEAGGGTCQCGACLCERFRSAVRACREHG